jgi:hypothetical protein
MCDSAALMLGMLILHLSNPCRIAGAPVNCVPGGAGRSTAGAGYHACGQLMTMILALLQTAFRESSATP